MTRQKTMEKRTADLRRVARDRFGYDSVLPEQEEAMLSVLDRRDTLVVMPTASGKSAIYQVCGLLLKGATVVVSPLIALQRDQVEGLTETGVPDAVHLNSTLTDARRADVFEALSAGAVEFLFLAPEQLARADTREALREARLSLFVVDEAHCISAWGHDFRPEYLRLGAVLAELGRPTVLALTATASPLVREEIVERLHMREPAVFVFGFDRPNIHLRVERFADEARKQEALLECVVQADKPGIVYVATKKAAEELSARLWEKGVSSVYYHGGMTKTEREQAQRAFMDDEVEVVVATTAFGMGIDKPNVRFVFHYDIPDSLDSYYQEIGRAGRDGKRAEALLLYRSEDLGLRRFFAGTGRVDREQLEQVGEEVAGSADGADADEIRDETGLSRSKVNTALSLLEGTGFLDVGPSGEARMRDDDDVSNVSREAVEAAEVYKRVEESRLEMMRGYAETRACRRAFLLNYFGEPFEGPCGFCDNCEAGRTTSSDDNAPFRLNARVEHKEWGEGTVVRYADGKLVVLFDEMGYRTLSVDAVDERGLLREVG